MWQTALVSLAVLLCACHTAKAPSAERVDRDVRAYIVKVQGRSDDRAQKCRRAATAAAVASADVLTRLQQGAQIAASLHLQLAVADKAMQEACRAAVSSPL